MFLFNSRQVVVIVAAICFASAIGFSTAHGFDETIDFQTQVRPLLSDRCFHCHGPDSKNQESAFRADTQDNLFADLGGYAAVVPGDLDASELHRRIHSDDPDEMMPPADSKRSLSNEDKRILDLWIEQGAPYASHWSFSVPRRPQTPVQRLQDAIGNDGWDAATVARWTANPIDAFVAKKLIEANLHPAPEADPESLLRRVSLTLTGLLPPERLQQKFLSDPSDEAYREAVDELLQSMDYAERQALRWLDAARYADTDGYQNDNERTNWPWRDWVIQSFHENMPFDQFTIEQLAGDMLPDATIEQELASAFNRNHRQNSEFGALAEEFFVENVIDRVETTATVWLGLTMGCCRCHDHKYDPLSQKEFFQFYAYFNNIGEKGIGRGVDANPTMKTVSPLADLDPQLVAAVNQAEADLKAAQQGLDKRMQTWIAETLENKQVGQNNVSTSEGWSNVTFLSAEVIGEGKLVSQTSADGEELKYIGNAADDVEYRLQLSTTEPSINALLIEALPDDSFGNPRKLAPSNNGNFVLTDLKANFENEPLSISNILASFEQADYPVTAAIDDNPKSGWAVYQTGEAPETVRAFLQFSNAVTLSPAQPLELRLKFQSDFGGHVIGKFRIKVAKRTRDSDPLVQMDKKLLAIMRKPAGKRSADDRKRLTQYYETVDPTLVAARTQFKTIEQTLSSQGVTPAIVMVMHEREGQPAPAFLLNRGQYDDPDKSEVLERGVPTALLPEGVAQPADRLELARWLVSPQNPLTARVIVNRMWQDHFGIGLVKTAEDFGSQGEVPSHPALLDWLALEFIESGWNVQAMHRLIVTSATYRQSSQVTQALHDQDPQNRLLARGPRYRADGFVIRDLALQASGLLSKKSGGPPVKPYQPDGLWAEVAANVGTKYDTSTGEDLFRKSLYTYWKRAVNPPGMTIFDSGGREICSVAVRRTNTPLQALALMNDPTYVEAARKLAERVLTSESSDDHAKLHQMYRLATSRQCQEPTFLVLTDNLNFFRNHFTEHPAEADQLLSIGESSRDEKLNQIEYAAFTAVAHLILNLDEFITIE